MSTKWSRRRFTKAILSAQALMASGTLTLPLACAETKKNEGNLALDSSQQETLRLAMDEIISAYGKMPSASKIGSLDYVLNILEELPDLSPLFVGLIASIEAQSRQRVNVPFSKLSSEKRINVLTAIEQTEPELFKVLKDFTYESYYTNSTIHGLIAYEPYPTGTSGPEMEPFDEKLLNRVKNAPPIYIKI